MLENLLGARAAGAEVLTHCEVTEIRFEQGAVDSLRYVDRIDQVEHELSVGTVVNAAGPWVDRVLATAPTRTGRHIGGTKGSHIIVGRFDGAPKDAFYVEAAADGRPFFILPWNDQYLIGTTDIRYTGDLDDIRASDEEVDYLLSETNRVFPAAGLSRSDIHYAYAGVRPLPHQEKGPESAITRRHIIKFDRDVGKGLISIIGGKLTTYRSLAEQAVDKIAKLQKKKLPACRTRDNLLPGTWGREVALERLQSLGVLSDAGVSRLLSIYGGRATAICDICDSNQSLARAIDEQGRVLGAEVVFALREEFARTLADVVFRRMMIGLDADQGRPLYETIADIAAGETGWSKEQRARQLDELRAFSDSWRVD